MPRDDLFTNIHKSIRAGLFDLVTTAGATDWSDPTDVDRLACKWKRMHALLVDHTHHEDSHILRILDSHDPTATEAAGAQHHTLDGWLDEMASWVDTIVDDPDPVRGLALYRELALFCADHLIHMHDEETTVMARIWELCTDAEIAATRTAFMATMDPVAPDASLRLMLPAIDPPTRTSLIAGFAATAPRPALEGILAIARDVLDTTEADRLAAAAMGVAV